jgi:hypothetical protein
MAGLDGKLPKPRWTVRKGPTIAVSQAGGTVLLAYANDHRRRLRVFDLNNPEKTNITDVTILRLDCATGTTEPMPTLACPDDSGQCFLLDGILHVNCGSSVARWDSTKSSWRTAVQKKAHELQSPLLSLDNSIYALWRVPEGKGVRFSKTTKNKTIWGPSFGPEAYVYEACWQLYRGEFYVRCQVGGLSPVDPGIPTMFRVSQDTLSVTTEAAVGLRGKLLIADEQLFCDGIVDFGEVATPRKQFLPKGSNRRLGEFTVTEMSGYIPSQSTFLSCYELPTLRLKKRWRIWNEAGSLTIAPERKGILVTHKGSERSVRLLSSRTPGPMLIGAMDGLPICDPVSLGKYVVWLCHPGDTSDYYTLHDDWPSIQAQIESKKSEVKTVVQWFDSESQKWRRASPRDEKEPSYVLTALDTETGKWIARELAFEEPIYTILAHGDDLVFVGWSQVRSYPVKSLLELCQSSGKMPDVLGDPISADAPIVRGLPFSGPVADDWGFRSASAVGLKLLKAAYAPADFARLEQDSDLRAKAVDDLLERTVNVVNESWPDIRQLALRTCPSPISRAYSSNVDTVERTPFGKLANDSSFVAQLVDWYHNLKEGAEHNLPGKEQALLIARFLLHEYIRRLKTGVWRDYEKPRVKVPTSGPYEELLGWYNLGVDQTSKTDDSPSTLQARTKSFFKRIFMRDNVVMENVVDDLHPTGLDMVRLHERWPDGCPPLIQDAGARLAYLSYCLEMAALIAPHKRSRLQAAVARSWENPVVRGGKQVFISYSHATPQHAQQIADGLRRRGLGVALDVHDLSADAQDWDVETWIAENISACDVVVYITSENFVASGWINRETEWEHRLYGVKPAVILPYVVLTDRDFDLPSYPRSRMCKVSSVGTTKQIEAILNELVIRISYDLTRALLFDKSPLNSFS